MIYTYIDSMICKSSNTTQVTLAILYLSTSPSSSLLQIHTVQQCHVHVSISSGEPTSVTITPHTTALYIQYVCIDICIQFVLLDIDLVAIVSHTTK